DTTIIGNFTLDCGIVQDTISIALVESPDPNLIFSDAGCGSPTGSASIIDPASSWTVQWLDAFGNAIGSGSTISELPAGSYQAEVSNVGNTTACSTLVPFSIEEVPTLVIEEVQVTSNPCSNDTNGVLEVISVIGEGDFTIEWLDANTGQLLSTDARLENLPNATYLLRITDEFDCVIEQQFVIDAPVLPIVSVSTDPAFCDNPNGAIFIDNMDSAPLQIELDGQKVSEEELVDLFPNAYQLLIRSEADCIVLDSNLIIQNIIDTTLSGQLTLSGFSNRPIPIDLGLTDLVGLSISWSPTNGLSCIDCFNPIAELEESRIVQAILVDTITGCTGTYQVAITIRPEEQVYIPNAFSPNDDGINDFFQVFPSDEEVVILGVQVYSRWGELVYEQTGADVRWNGTANGSVLPSGVYVYVVEVQYSNRKELISGDVALLR
ncbi:MAG: gliding motility-associated C-terminal domain-containing protein, partial [Bacteroidota bacterium]